MSAIYLLILDLRHPEQLLDKLGVERILSSILLSCLFLFLHSLLQELADEVIFGPLRDLLTLLELDYFIGIAVAKMLLVWRKSAQVDVLKSQKRILAIDNLIRLLSHLEVDLAEKSVLCSCHIHGLAVFL